MDTDEAHPHWHQFPHEELRPARLADRLERLAMIEQAKGIIMAKIGCTDVQAFDILRAVSQRRNVPVRDLAAQLIAQTVHNIQPPSSTGLQSIGRRDDPRLALRGLLSSFAPDVKLPDDPGPKAR